MPRSARGLLDGGIYHILNRGNGRQKVFHKDADYAAFLDVIEHMIVRYEVDLYAYCLMPNHYHLVVKAVKSEDLSNGMRWFATTHVRRYHKHYKSSGHLWQGRYKSFVIENDNHLLTLVRYVEGNPVRAKLVDSAIHWGWSSHRVRALKDKHAEIVDTCLKTGKKKMNLLSSLPVDLPKDWTQYVDTPLSATELEKIRPEGGQSP